MTYSFNYYSLFEVILFPRFHCLWLRTEVIDTLSTHLRRHEADDENLNGDGARMTHKEIAIYTTTLDTEVNNTVAKREVCPWLVFKINRRCELDTYLAGIQVPKSDLNAF